MATELTKQQLQAVTNRGGKLLVSAAAGSGKTKVLVERLLSYLMDSCNPANIDDFLIITYTKAAAAELRGKIATELSRQIALKPENRHLQRQIQRLHLAKISTVHSFCSDILREYAYLLDISADFRVADEDECIELQARAMQQVLESAYAQTEADRDFYAFVDSQGFGRDDRRVPEIILQVYNSAHCHLDPNAWLDWCTRVQNINDVNDVSETIWGKFLIEDLHRYLELQISAMQACAERATAAFDMEKPAQLLAGTVDQLRALRNCNRWNEIIDHSNIDYGRLAFSKKCTDVELIDQIKAVRDACKNGLCKKLAKFVDSSEQLISDYSKTQSAVRGLLSLVRQFTQVYAKLKHSRRILDFTDLEQRTLDLLLGRSRSGATKAASEIGKRFLEVMIDEYQDSNEVQDAIFTALTQQRQNCFMVGDVKQSIYQFRLADPSIFIEKYNGYQHADVAKAGEGRKVILSNNFRSSGEVIEAVNDVFRTCMSPDVGGLHYGTDEALHEGFEHIPLDGQSIELYGIDVQTDTYHEEAAFVAARIKELLDGTHMVRQSDTLRPITAEDIVILLRSPGSVGLTYQYALECCGIPCTTGSGANLLEAEEIETLHALLQVINNPLLDIPLVAVLSSRIFAFTADELAQIRSEHKAGSLYAALESSKLTKAREFLDVLSRLRKEAKLSSISQLLMRIFSITRIDSVFGAMDDGAFRVENLHSFCQMATAYENASADGLSRLLDHLAVMGQRGMTVQTEGNNVGAVRIMSIHKSKGLEFPVVFLCGLSRDFNQESLRAQVLCDKEFGLGLSCVDTDRRIQYPSIVKNAIIAKMKAESISEEMRVLYVAMTRAKDRLIMTYSVKNIHREIDEISNRIALSDPLLLTATAQCPGTWILLTAIANPTNSFKIQIVQAPDETDSEIADVGTEEIALPDELVDTLKKSLKFRYPYMDATTTPSKQTATQIKGRYKDQEAAENAAERFVHDRRWRKPSFVKQGISSADRGSAIHKVMQHICFNHCDCLTSVEQEIHRLVEEQYITAEQASSVEIEQIARFFATELGSRIRCSDHVLREFKFSILVDANGEKSNADDQILLQGVVDCALIEDDGITVVDFKSDTVNESNIEAAVMRYRTQITTYANALARIYQIPVKSAQLYFFALNTFVEVL